MQSLSMKARIGARVMETPRLRAGPGTRRGFADQPDIGKVCDRSGGLSVRTVVHDDDFGSGHVEILAVQGIQASRQPLGIVQMRDDHGNHGIGGRGCRNNWPDGCFRVRFEAHHDWLLPQPARSGGNAIACSMAVAGGDQPDRQSGNS